MARHQRLILGLLVAGCAVSGIVLRSQGRQVEWRYYGGDKGFTRYSPLDQINRNNVKSLQIAWRRPAVSDELQRAFKDLKVTGYLKSTPIMIDGVLYVQNIHGLVTAFSADGGKALWQQELPEMTLDEANGGQSTRGLDYWKSGSDERVFAVRGEFLYALNAKTGRPYIDFGDRGRAGLHFSNEPEALAGKFNDTSGPIVVGDVVVIGGYTNGAGDGGAKKERARDDVRGFDTRTGKLLWTFHVVPQQGEFGADTWGNDSWKYAGDLAAWCPLTADEQLGYIYVPLTAPTSASYGGWRPGDNLYSDSLVAIDAKSGKRVWHYQMIHHDLWEWDNIGPPVLGDLTVNGRKIKAVMQPNKNAFLYVLDRVTGEPVWPIEERAVPQSTVPGEKTSATQPFPTRPPAFDRQGVSESDLIDFTPELRAKAQEFVKTVALGPIYTPPSMASAEKRGTLGTPGAWGAGNWNTGAFDPETGMYYAVSHTLPSIRGIRSTQGVEGATMEYQGGGGGQGQSAQPPGFVQGLGPQIEGLPLLKPPYGRITALNLNTGDRAWMVPNGDGPRDHPLLKDLHLPPLGIPNRPAPLVTKTLLFIGEGSDAIIGTPQVPWAWGKKFRAYDKATGGVIWETELPSGATGAPMTYMYKGKQYIVVPIGAKDHPAEFVALALSDAKATTNGNR